MREQMAKKTQQTKTETEVKTSPTALVEVPYVEDLDPTAYRPYHLNLHISVEQRTALKKLTEALRRDGATCTNERRIEREVGSHVDSIRWLLDQLADKFT